MRCIGIQGRGPDKEIDKNRPSADIQPFRGREGEDKAGASLDERILLHERKRQIEVLSFAKSKIQARYQIARTPRVSSHEKNHTLQKEILDKTFRLSIEMRINQN